MRRNFILLQKLIRYQCSSNFLTNSSILCNTTLSDGNIPNAMHKKILNEGIWIKFVKKIGLRLTLAEHIAKSREVVAANKAKGNRHAELFATMYDQPSRFIEEILQNTEDAYARKNADDAVNKVRFKLFNDRIEIHHNGKDFDEADLMSITTFAHTTKKNNKEVNQIGKFGIGFKSVFSVTDAPEIHCEPYHYSITDYEVLEETRVKKPDENFNTLIVLPFKKKNPADCFDTVNKGLNNLNEYSLLFLKKIACIEIYISGALSLSLERLSAEINNAYRDLTIRKTFSNPVLNEQHLNFLIFSRNPRSEKQQPELAFKIEKTAGNNFVIPIHNASVFVYFPTKVNSRLNFILNAPFTTNPLREYIPFDDHSAQENTRLLNESAALFVKALKILKQKKWYDLHLVSILPINTEKSSEINRANGFIVYQAFYNALLRFFKTEPSIPIAPDRCAIMDDTVIPHNDEMAGLLNSSDLQRFYQKNHFVDPLINAKQFDEVRSYFTEVLQIKTADAQSFGFRLLINEGFLQSKNHEWLVRFYKYVHRNQFLWDVQHSAEYYSLRNAAIILTQDKLFQPAFDAEKRLKVFFPVEKKCLLPIVNNKFLKNDECMAFFKDLGINEPEPADDVEFNIIPQFETRPLVFGKEYIKSLEKILETYISVSLLRKEKMVGLLKKAPWVYCTTGDSTKKFNFKKPDETYTFSADLIDYFENYDEACVVEPGLFKKLNKKFNGAFSLLLEDAGVRTFPERKIINEKLVDIDGFDFFLKAVTLKRSKAFINLLLSFSDEFFTEGFFDYLKNKSWIYTKNILFEPLETINKSAISGLYKLSDSEKTRLCNLLGIAENTQQSHERYINWQSAVSPEEAGFYYDQDNIKPGIFTPGLFSVANMELLAPSFAEEQKKDENSVYSEEDLKKIHLWSCGFIENMLTKTSPDNNYVIESCENADRILKKDGRILQYIFVCGKTNLLNAFPLNVSQLTHIIKLFRSAEDTCLYFVSAVGTKNAAFKVLKNPLDFLTQGKLLSDSNVWIKGLF